MPNNKRKVVEDSSDEEDKIVYVLGKRTLANMRLFLMAIEQPLWQVKDGEGPDEESTDAEKFLLGTICTKPGQIDVDKTMELLKEDHNHLPVMEALGCIFSFDLDMKDIEDFAGTAEEVEEIRRILKYLPKWGKIATEERERASKKCKSE